MNTCLIWAYHFEWSYELASKAILRQASGDVVSTCLPSRLSRVRAPSPALFPQPSLSMGLASRLTASKQWYHFEATVSFCVKRRSTNTCRVFWQTPASPFTSWQKCSRTRLGRLLVTGTASEATIDHLLRKNKWGRFSTRGYYNNQFVVVWYQLFFKEGLSLTRFFNLFGCPAGFHARKFVCLSRWKKQKNGTVGRDEVFVQDLSSLVRSSLGQAKKMRRSKQWAKTNR